MNIIAIRARFVKVFKEFSEYLKELKLMVFIALILCYNLAMGY